MKSYVLVFLAAFCVCIYANPLIGKSVEPVKKGTFPFTASLAYAPADRAEYHFCGGALISKNHILTATHCFQNVIKTNIRATVNSFDVTKGKKYQISSWKTYEQWASEHNITVDDIYHDVAIVQLAEDVKRVKPVAISQCTHQELRGRKAVTAGWGTTNKDVLPKFLLKSKLELLAKDKCKINFAHAKAPNYMLLNHICTISKPPVVLGRGDCGSPLLINDNELIGINECVSLDDIKHPNEQNVHQSVHYYRKFIEAFAEKKADCPFRHASGSTSGASKG